MHSAQKLLKDCLKLLEQKRKNCDTKFATIFREVDSLAQSELGMQLTIPRRTGRQVHRENYPTNDPLNFYKQSIFIPLIENVLEDLKDRFSEETLSLYNLSMLFPSSEFDVSTSTIMVKDVAKKYRSFFPNNCEFLIERNIIAELENWNLKWENKPCDAMTALDLLLHCDADIYPFLNKLLKIFVSLPVSIASAERSFSTLRRVKTWLRANMLEDRLSGLALLNIHRDINLDIEKVIDRYARIRKNHRLEFVI